MVIHPFLGLELVDSAISRDDPASWRSHDIAVGRHFDGPTTPAAETHAVPGFQTGLVAAGLTTNTAATGPVSSKFAFTLRRPR
jgi:hypothetical protein